MRYTRAVVATLLYSMALGLSMAPVSTSLAAERSSGRTTDIARVAQGADLKWVRVEFIDGTRKTVRSEKGDTFGAPRSTLDHRTTAWTVDRFLDAAYRVPIWVQTVHDGVLHDIGCDHGVPYAWAFVDGSHMVLHCSFPHGPQATRHELADLTTGKTVTHIDIADEEVLPAAAPAWARIGNTE